MAKNETVLSVIKEIRDIVKEAVKGSVKMAGDSKIEGTRFIKNSDGSVLDKQTGLIWGPTLSDRMNWAAADKACKEFNLGGHKDWRLPTVNELFSLVDRKKYNPAIDIEFFPDTKNDWYWTNEKYVGDSGCCWVVYFGNGSVYVGSKGIDYFMRPVRVGK